MAIAISGKWRKLEKEGYRKFPADWLAIYDNRPLPKLNFEEAVALLVPQVAPLRNWIPWFDTVMEHGAVIFELTQSKRALHGLVNLW